MSSQDSQLARLKHRSHALRNFNPREFVEAYEQIESNEELTELREALQRIDGGRWYDALDEMHKVFAAKDLEGRREFADDHPELMRWLQVFGMVEELNQFQNWQPEGDE